MKLGYLLGWSSIAMLGACTTVYHLTPVKSEDSAALAQPSPPEAEPLELEIATPEEEPSALRVEARVGHETVRAGDSTYLMLELVGKEGSGTTAETSTALVIDVSGSMQGARIRQAALAARGWIERAADGEVVGLYTFNQQADELLPPTQLSGSSRITMLGAVDQIATGGNTCLSCGVQWANSRISATGDGRVRRIVVLSDGEANVGTTSVQGMSAIAANCRDRGVSVTTIGLGLGYNEKVLAALAAKSNGLHHFVQRSEDLPAVFEREAANLRATVAADVEVEFELDADVKLVRVVDRDFRLDDDSVKVRLGAIAEGDAHTVLLELSVPQERGDQPLADVQVRYHDPASSAPQVLQREMSVQIGDRRSELDPLVAMRLERSRTAAAMIQASLLFEQGSQQEAQRQLEQRIRALRTQAAILEQRARSRGDARSADIARDLQSQAQHTRQAKKSFATARPSAPSGRAAVRSVAPAGPVMIR